MADYILTDHALMEMRRRDISEEEIKKVMISPEQRLNIRKGRCVYQSRLAYGEPVRDFLVRVFAWIQIVNQTKWSPYIVPVK